jgi:predicted DNA-binding transcriptional regulator YafY
VTDTFQLPSVIKNAIDSNVSINLVYISKDGTRSTRTVDPKDINPNSFLAYDANKYNFRRFLLNRVESIQLTDYTQEDIDED